MNNPYEKRLASLYALLNQLEAKGDDDTAAALRWGIFALETVKEAG